MNERQYRQYTNYSSAASVFLGWTVGYLIGSAITCRVTRVEAIIAAVFAAIGLFCARRAWRAHLIDEPEPDAPNYDDGGYDD